MNSLHVFIFACLEKRLCITNHSDHVLYACGEGVCLSPAQIPSHNLLRRFHSLFDWPFLPLQYIDKQNSGLRPTAGAKLLGKWNGIQNVE